LFPSENKQEMSFLTAEWRKLAIANYEIDPKILEKYVPYGTELDLWENKCYVSLIGFMFLKTKLLGIKIPFHQNFEEVNLRFYVKRFEDGAWKRGAVFLKEIVPKYAISWVANTIYNESYQTLPMRHFWSETAENRQIEYFWKKKGWHTFKITAEKQVREIEIGSKTEFITEHYWGYAKINKIKTNEYQVTHPKWTHFEVLDYEINVDFEVIYGKEFAFLNQTKPSSVMLAEGSAITIEQKKVLF
jgi:uncharacterized protein